MAYNKHEINSNTHDDSFLSEIERKILQAITMYNRPVTAQEIAYELALSLHIANNAFHNLVKNGNLIVISPANSSSQYYAASNSKEAIDQILLQKYVDLIEPLEKKFEEIKHAQDRLNDQLHGVYAQITTLMGIFVAIFALIIINVNAIVEFTRTITAPCELLKALAILNLPLVISLAVLVALIKWVIKSPRKKK